MKCFLEVFPMRSQDSETHTHVLRKKGMSKSHIQLEKKKQTNKPFLGVEQSISCHLTYIHTYLYTKNHTLKFFSIDIKHVCLRLSPLPPSSPPPLVSFLRRQQAYLFSSR